MHILLLHALIAAMAQWLRWRTEDPWGFPYVGSNPACSGFTLSQNEEVTCEKY